MPSEQRKLKRAAARLRRLLSKQKRDDFIQAVKLELRQHRPSFVVYVILSALTIFTLVRSILNGSYENTFLCILTLALLLIPSIMQVRFHVEIPITLEITLLIFIFAGEVLGEIEQFYTIFPYWDTLLHTINGFLAAAIGFSFAIVLNRDEHVAFRMSPFFLSLVAFSFSMTVGVLWEFVEFFGDQLTGADMQKDTIIQSISSIALNPDGVQKPIAINDIHSTVVNGVDLGIDGYLDIGLYDTMEDLFVNFIGALIFSIIGNLAIRGGENEQRITNSLMLSKKRTSDDYLKQIEARDSELKELRNRILDLEMQQAELEKRSKRRKGRG